MREIEFRAIHKLTLKKWDEEDLYFHDGNWYEDFRALEDGRPLNLKQCEIMQYTGLKDKNGTKIYEGDIIKYIVRKPMLPEFYVVEDMANYHDMRILEKLSSKTTSVVEIIGNIYEHSHLLESEKNERN